MESFAAFGCLGHTSSGGVLQLLAETQRTVPGLRHTSPKHRIAQNWDVPPKQRVLNGD